MSAMPADAIVTRMRDALAKAGVPIDLRMAPEGATTAVDIAKALGCDPGAVVRSRIYVAGDKMALAMIAGDHRVLTAGIGKALNAKGSVRAAEAGEIKFATGVGMTAVAPFALARPLPSVMDRSLKRFETVFVSAGHPRCFVAIAPDRLARALGAVVSLAVAAPMTPEIAAAAQPKPRPPAEAPKRRATKAAGRIPIMERPPGKAPPPGAKG